MAWIARLVQVCYTVSEWDGHCLRYGAGVLMAVSYTHLTLPTSDLV